MLSRSIFRCMRGALLAMTLLITHAHAQSVDVFGRTSSGAPSTANAQPSSTVPAWVREVVSTGVRLQSELNESMQDALTDQQTGWHPLAALTLMLMAFAYGVLHALGPGHGKTVVGAYLLSHPARVRESVILGVWSAMAQALCAIALVGAAAWITRHGLSNVLTRAARLEAVSYGALLCVGVWTAWSILTRRDCCDVAGGKLASFKEAIGNRNDPITHDAAYLGSRLTQHRRRRSPSAGPQAVAKQIFFTGLAVGIRPCAGALFVLIAALDQNVFAFGIAATLAMGAGVAITVCAIGLASTGINRKLVIRPPSKRAVLRNARRHLAFAGACLISLFAAWQLLALALGWQASSLV
jgi:nickel/cobalt transporter (NicO) family protein